MVPEVVDQEDGYMPQGLYFPRSLTSGWNLVSG